MWWVIVVEVLFALVGAAVGALWIIKGKRQRPADIIIAIFIMAVVWLILTTFVLLGTGYLGHGFGSGASAPGAPHPLPHTTTPGGAR